MQRIKEETADVMIYCFGIGAVLGIDLGAAVKLKLRMNAKKYPVKK